eukprot:g737.t1
MGTVASAGKAVKSVWRPFRRKGAATSSASSAEAPGLAPQAAAEAPAEAAAEAAVATGLGTAALPLPVTTIHDRCPLARGQNDLGKGDTKSDLLIPSREDRSKEATVQRDTTSSGRDAAEKKRSRSRREDRAKTAVAEGDDVLRAVHRDRRASPKAEAAGGTPDRTATSSKAQDAGQRTPLADGETNAEGPSGLTRLPEGSCTPEPISPMKADETPMPPSRTLEDLPKPWVRVPHEDRKPGPGTGWIREEPTSTRGRYVDSQDFMVYMGTSSLLLEDEFYFWNTETDEVTWDFEDCFTAALSLPISPTEAGLQDSQAVEGLDSEEEDEDLEALAAALREAKVWQSEASMELANPNLPAENVTLPSVEVVPEQASVGGASDSDPVANTTGDPVANTTTTTPDAKVQMAADRPLIDPQDLSFSRMGFLSPGSPLRRTISSAISRRAGDFYELWREQRVGHSSERLAGEESFVEQRSRSSSPQKMGSPMKRPREKEKQMAHCKESPKKRVASSQDGGPRRLKPSPKGEVVSPPRRRSPAEASPARNPEEGFARVGTRRSRPKPCLAFLVQDGPPGSRLRQERPAPKDANASNPKDAKVKDPSQRPPSAGVSSVRVPRPRKVRLAPCPMCSTPSTAQEVPSPAPKCTDSLREELRGARQRKEAKLVKAGAAALSKIPQLPSQLGVLWENSWKAPDTKGVPPYFGRSSWASEE